MKLNKINSGLLLAGCLGFACNANAASAIVSVDSHAGPWDFVNAGLNTGDQYGPHDFSAPVVVNSGFDFTPGGTFSITALAGLTSPYGGLPYADAGGDLGYVADDTGGSSGLFFPSLYFDHADYPAYLNELVGTFADSLISGWRLPVASFFSWNSGCTARPRFQKTWPFTRNFSCG